MYEFIWHEYCDWYLELLKPVFQGDDETAKKEAQACAAYVLDQAYKMLHPFMPFMTEELWGLTANNRDTLICHAPWPEADFADDEAAEEINWLIELVSGIRSVRAEMNVPPSAKAPLIFVDAGDVTRGRMERNAAAIQWLARVETLSLADAAPDGSAQIVVGESTACLPLGSLVDVAAESARIEKAIGKVRGDMAKIEGKLNNEKFVQNAKPEIVQAEREKLSLQQDALQLVATPEMESQLGLVIASMKNFAVNAITRIETAIPNAQPEELELLEDLFNKDLKQVCDEVSSVPS